MIDLRSLTSFAQVAETGSITRAAVTLGVSVSVISRQLQEFESRVGYRVFYRTGRGVRLTDLGQRLYPQVKQFLTDAIRLSDTAVGLGRAPSGTVTIGLPGTVSQILAEPLYHAVHNSYPRVAIRLVDGLSGAIDELLSLGRIDLGLFFVDALRARHGALPLCTADLVLVGRADDHLTKQDTVSLRQLDGIPLILPSKPNALRHRVERVWAEHGLNLVVPLEADALSTRIELVAGHIAYTLAPFQVFPINVATRRLRVARIVRPSIQRYVVLASSRKGPITLAAKAVADKITSVVSALAQRGHLEPAQGI